MMMAVVALAMSATTVTIWSEDWSTGTAGQFPSEVTNANAVYSQTGTATKLYAKSSFTDPELLVAKSSNNGSFTATVTLNGASGELTLEYDCNRNINLSVTDGTLGEKASDGSHYTVPITVASGTSTIAITWTNQMSSNSRLSNIVLTYESSGGDTPVVETVATPEIEADGADGKNQAGEWIDEADVTITCATSGATIYYTLDGSDPTDQSSEYLAPFTVNTTTTVKAIAVNDGMNDSAIASLLVEIGEADPVGPTPTSDVIWSEDWSTGTAGQFPSDVTNANAVYTQTGTATKLYAKSSFTDPELLVAKSSNNGSFTATVTLNGASGELTLEYDCNKNIDLSVTGGTLGTKASEDTHYTVPITVASGTSTIAITWTNQMSSNSRLSNIVLKGAGGDTPVVETVATPEIEADGGDGQNSQGEWIDEADVTITCTTSGATIYYTLDGSDPTDQSSEYLAPFTVNTTCTVKAIAMKSDMNNSAIASLLVKIGEADPVNPTGYTDDEITRSTLDFGSVTSGYADFTTAALSSGAEYAGVAYASNSTQIQLRTTNSNEGLVSTVSGGNIRKVKLTWGSNTNAARIIQVYGSNSAYTDASDLYAAATQGTLLGELGTTDTELSVTNDYAYVGIRSKSSALYLDGVTFTWEAAEAPAVAAPVITVQDESVIGDQTVEITCATDGAAIYYTTDGGDPAASDALYVGPFTVSADCTVKAVAYDGTNYSAITAKVITINVAISVEDAYALDATDTSLKNKEYTIAFEDAKVIYVGAKNSNKYTYVREGDESILLYNDGLNLPLNAIINGYATFKFNPYNGLPEFAAVSAAITNTDHLTITESSEAAQPIPATVDDIANGLYLNNLVALKNVPVVENEGKYYASNDEGETLLFQIYDQFGTGALENFTSSGSNGIRRKATPVGGNDGFDITGMVGKYNTTLQIQPTSSSSIVTGVEEIAAEKNVESVRYFNLLGVESNEPFAGMNVVVTTYTDGTKAARKVVK